MCRGSPVAAHGADRLGQAPFGLGHGGSSNSKPPLKLPVVHLQDAVTAPTPCEMKQLLLENLKLQASRGVDQADTELQKATTAIRKSRDSKLQSAAWINEETEVLQKFLQLARQDPLQFVCKFRLLVRLFVRKVEHYVWDQVQAYESSVRSTVTSVKKTLELVCQPAVDGNRSLQRALENMDRTLTKLQVKAIQVVNSTIGRLPQVVREMRTVELCISMPEAMHRCPCRDDGAYPLQQSLCALAEMGLAVHQAQLLVKPAQHVMIASVRSAICTGLESSEVRAVLEANVNALVQMRRQRKPNAKRTVTAKGSKRKHQAPTPLEAVEEVS